MKTISISIFLFILFYSTISIAQVKTFKNKKYRSTVSYKDSILNNIIIQNEKDTILYQFVLSDSVGNSTVNLSKIKFKKSTIFSYFTVFSNEKKRIKKAEAIIHYIGYFDDGIQFDNSFVRGKPLQINFQKNYFLKSFSSAIQKFNVGDIGLIKIEPKYAYKDKQAGNIPPNSTLYYLIQVINEQ